MLESIRNQIRALLDERSAHQASLDEVIATAEARDDSALTDDESARFNEARDAIGATDAELVTLRDREAELVQIAEARQAADDLAARVGGPASEQRTVEVRVGSEPDVYRSDGDHSFLVDAYRAEFASDFEARDRLARHGRQIEDRAVGTSAFGALVPPAYLVDEYGPLARAGRPFSNAVRSVQLPDTGMVINVPKITTGTTVDDQGTENTDVDETDMDETTVAVSVRTLAGQQDVSRQALERGQNIDRIVFADLAGAYSTALDAANITATLGTAGIETVTYTDASPTIAGLWPRLADAVQRVNSLRFAPATAMFMHPRRWGWLTAQLDGQSGRPLVAAGEPRNAMGLGTAAEYGQVVGEVLGVPVITDANIPINLGSGEDEDRIIVAKADDLLLFEDLSGAPHELRFEQTTGGSLTVKLVAYGYSAFTALRSPKSVAVIAGTGLVTPTWT